MERDISKEGPNQVKLLKFSDPKGGEISLTMKEFQRAFRIYRSLVEDDKTVNDAFLVNILAAEFPRMSPKEIGVLVGLIKKTR